MRPSIKRQDLESRINQLIEILKLSNANLDVQTGREALDKATEPMVTRGILVVEGERYRVRERAVLRYYARTLNHLFKDRDQSDFMH